MIGNCCILTKYKQSHTHLLKYEKEITMICPFCAKEIKDDSKFCGKCGRQIPRCPTCGKVIRKWMLFCTNDGTPLPKEVIDLFPDTYQPPKENLDARRTTRKPIEENKDFAHISVSSDVSHATKQNNVKRKKKSVIPALVSIIIILCIALATGVGYAIWKFQNIRQEAANVAENQGVTALLDESTQTSAETSESEKNESVDMQKNFDFDAADEKIQQEDSEIVVPDTNSAASSDTNVEHQQPTDKLQYFITHCDSEYFTENDIQTFDADMCRIARNSIYARLGRKFDDQELTAYFKQYDWYIPTIDPEDFSEEMLNQYQIANRDLIVTFETKKGYR